MSTVLVAYSSKHGSTAEIAQTIGQEVRGAGLDVHVQLADEVADLTPYSAVVLGSAVYTGRWLPEAVSFLEAHQGALATRPVWLFSSGPTGPGDPVERLDGWRFPAQQQPLADRIRPRDTALFHGKITLSALQFGEGLMIRALGAPVGDFRDWAAISSWAQGIAAALLAGSSGPRRA